MLRSLPQIGHAKEPVFNAMWRSKQLEYTFRRTVMGSYEPMTLCTRHALDFCCDAFGADVREGDRRRLCEAYLRLPAFPDCREGLESLGAHGHRCIAFSNGTQTDIGQLLANAELDDCFGGVVVVDDMPRPAFKPSAAAYSFFTSSMASDPSETWLVSSNPFDIIGAAACDWKTVWMKRGAGSGHAFDPWPDARGPTVTIGSFAELLGAIAGVE